MYRCSPATRRLLTAPHARNTPPLRLLPSLARTQPYSSNAGSGDGPGFTRRTRFIGLAVAGGALLWYVSRKRRVAVAERHRQRGRRDNELPEVSGADADGPPGSPVKVVDWAEVAGRIRQQATSFRFDGHGGARGRIDAVRFESNCPTEDRWAVGVGEGVGGAKTVYAGIYDGHAGWACAEVLRNKLIPYVSAMLAPLAPDAAGDAVDTAIQQAFCRLDDQIMAAGRAAVTDTTSPVDAAAMSALAPAIAGSCALMAVYDTQTSTLRTAVTGDSRAVLGSWSSATGTHAASALSADQTGFNADEVARLDAAHPGEKSAILDDKTGRLMGLAVTRAFGDHRWKYEQALVERLQKRFAGYAPRKASATPPYLTARPEVTTTRGVKGEDFVVMASDGLWDVISNEDAVACVAQWLQARKGRKGNKGGQVVREANWKYDEEGWASYKATPEYFAVGEDLDNAAVCLLRNALGGTRRSIVQGLVTTTTPLSRSVRDDITIQVIFFKDPYE
ncbi:Protein phosphatase 2C [Cordyceps fumosorosea ARSEF 2679]|uniref:Protein phosphatase 2C n=1 Tax=Cordyceps fumosorosea (strain ARSEF 2679) TaxID=1081104 RepID=A0A167LVA6_CORFA|nr:Protein phosphatase 2C [Cordyceps fumosorosea ARSEF 2679]OAA53554.1 Protein phosphatase 2C [Cordyceps fumosorosea ARSEF 2679]